MQPLSIAGSACGSVDSDVEDDLDPEYLFCEPKELGGVDDDGEYAARLREFREHWRAEAAAAASQVDRGGACGRTSTDVEPRTRADAVVLPGPADEEVTGAGEGPRLIRGRKLIVVEGSNGESSRVEIPISDLGQPLIAFPHRPRSRLPVQATHHQLRRSHGRGRIKLLWNGVFGTMGLRVR